MSCGDDFHHYRLKVDPVSKNGLKLQKSKYKLNMPDEKVAVIKVSKMFYPPQVEIK